MGRIHLHFHSIIQSSNTSVSLVELDDEMQIGEKVWIARKQLGAF